MADAIRTRCKFRVVSVETVDHAVKSEKVFSDDPTYATLHECEYEHEGRKYKIRSLAHAQNVKLAAQYDPSNKEDLSFSEATPSGEVKIYVSNPSVVNTFEIGKCYYVDLIPCK